MPIINVHRFMFTGAGLRSLARCTGKTSSRLSVLLGPLGLLSFTPFGRGDLRELPCEQWLYP
ncbi:hypothetical protein D3C84_175250 [compost metagenome]